MRTEAEQLHGLRVIANRIPEATFVFPVGYADTIVLRHRDREVVYAVGGYDIWTAGGSALLKTDLDADRATSELVRS